jgi:hypothetical protein
MEKDIEASVVIKAPIPNESQVTFVFGWKIMPSMCVLQLRNARFILIPPV